MIYTSNFGIFIVYIFIHDIYCFTQIENKHEPFIAIDLCYFHVKFEMNLAKGGSLSFDIRSWGPIFSFFRYFSRENDVIGRDKINENS